MRGCFVTATDTGVGKTILSAAIAAALIADGRRVRAFKPILTGLDDPPHGHWPRDHELLAAVTGADPQDVVLAGYGPAVSPHLAAELAHRPLALDEILAAIRGAEREGTTLIVEGVGGLLVPLSGEADVRDLARGLDLPVLIAARPGLGTINHALLTLDAARAAGLDVRAVVLTPWPHQPGVIERSNLETIARLGGVEVGTLAQVLSADPVALAAAAARMPLARWLG